MRQQRWEGENLRSEGNRFLIPIQLQFQFPGWTSEIQKQQRPGARDVQFAFNSHFKNNLIREEDPPTRHMQTHLDKKDQVEISSPSVEISSLILGLSFVVFRFHHKSCNSHLVTEHFSLQVQNTAAPRPCVSASRSSAVDQTEAQLLGPATLTTTHQMESVVCKTQILNVEFCKFADQNMWNF